VAPVKTLVQDIVRPPRGSTACCYAGLGAPHACHPGPAFQQQQVTRRPSGRVCTITALGSDRQCAGIKSHHISPVTSRLHRREQLNGGCCQRLAARLCKTARLCICKQKSRLKHYFQVHNLANRGLDCEANQQQSASKDVPEASAIANYIMLGGFSSCW
jgi:hypothetical protein